MFASLPSKPDHGAIERAILDLWEGEQTFQHVREANAEGPRFSFLDGPVTANKTLGVHTAWGRTLKDVYQRYKAMRGFHQRYQNGYDCQGLWIEVMVERQLGLNSKMDIEAYGLEKFARKCREVVVWSSQELTKGCIRLGQWMDWGRDYYTSSDANIEYIWRFLRAIHERDWLYRGHRPTEWCPRCGTSISAHELIGSYVDRTDPSLFVRLHLREREGESLVIWTTTPWTLPANVAVAVNPTAEYGRRANGEWVAVSRAPTESFEEVRPGADLVGWRYHGPFDMLEPGSKVNHRVIAWPEVSLEEGTGLVHIAPGCGTEDFELGRENGLPVLMPVNEAGEFVPEYGWLAGRSTAQVADAIVEDLDRRGLLVEAGTIVHRYPECWRCHTPLIFRVSDDWFISAEEIREPMREANRTVEWTPEFMGKRMDDWLVNMGDWNISRRRYYGLPLPFYPCSCGYVNVIGSRAELLERATAPVEDLPELHRPWIDAVKIRCQACGEEVERIREVGDVWLDAGIVPLSTLGWHNPTAVPGGYGTGAAEGLTAADLPDHATWEQWFPAEWVSEMYEQIRLWFYSMLFMSVALTGRSPYRKVLTYQKLLDEQGREMHGSWGNMIQAEDAFDRMGADVMRWLYCMQSPTQNLLFGYRGAQEVQRKLLTFWNCTTFLVNYGNIAGFTPSYDDLLSGPDGHLTLDRWIVARTRQLVAEATEAYEQYLTVNIPRAFESFVDDLSNWYIRRSRRRFWQDDQTALRTLWYALVQAVRVIAPIMPFLAEHLWQVLVRDAVAGAPSSVFLAGWPATEPADADLLRDVAAVRQVVELGRRARVATGLRVRQPLRRLVVDGAPRAAGYGEEIADELRVKEVVFSPVEATDLRVRPNQRVLGPRLGRELRAVSEALAAGEFTELDGGGFRVAGHDLAAEDVSVERVAKDGLAAASEGDVTVALDTRLDDELRREGRLNDTIHLVNTMRKEAGLEITDRISLTLPAGDTDLLAHRDWLMAETLAVSLDIGPGDRPTITRVTSPVASRG
jgi:isoleucyl-tRNA synthetase